MNPAGRQEFFILETDRRKNIYDYNNDRDDNSIRLLQQMHDCDDPAASNDIFQQVCNQEFSLFSEVMPGEERTHFKFDIYDGKLYVIQPDGVTDWVEMHDNGVNRARAFVDYDQDFDFYLDIAQAEKSEAMMQEEIAAGGEETTLIALSLCGDDVADEHHLRAIGRDPAKRRAYLRVSYFDGQKMSLYSNSIDGLDVDDAKEIYKQYLNVNLAYDITSPQILASPIPLIGDRRDLIEKIAGPWRESNHEFVLGQKDLLSEYIDSLRRLADKNTYHKKRAEEANDLRYGIMASLKQRYEGKWIDFGDIGTSIDYAGAAERELGTVFAGCDTVVSSQSQIKAAGYINSYTETLKNLTRSYFNSKKCSNCLPKPKGGKKVRAWQEGSKIGCTNCGHVIDICTKKIIKKGKKLSAKD